MIIVDAHENLAYNILVNGRDYLQSAYDTRVQAEENQLTQSNQCLLGLPEWLQGGVAVIFSSIFTKPRYAAQPGELGYVNTYGAYQQAVAQLNIYRQWADQHRQIQLIRERQDLNNTLESWNDDNPEENRQIGLVLLMENAAPLSSPQDVEWWHQQGVRLIGPAWHANAYTGSVEDSSPLTNLGRDLLAQMAKHNLILDLSHMSDTAALESLAIYEGPIVATHANPRRLIPTPRMLSDAIIEGIIEKDGVIGIMPANWTIKPNWKEGSGKDSVILADMAEAIDIVCQIAGDALHVGLGTNFGGNFGAESVPAEIDTIADMHRLTDALAAKGYRDDYIQAIMGGNWSRLLWKSLPESA